jgi:DNA-binding winged helix-turn-helix (wHTH) protein
VRYRFADLLLSPARRLLLRGGQPVPLSPRYLDLLLLLVAERQRVVPHDEIHRRVWGGAAVTDGAFTQAVRTVRRALGDDDPKQPRFVRTVARTGYQFVYPEVIEEDDSIPPPATPVGWEVAHGSGALAGVARPASVAGGAFGAAIAGVVVAILLGGLLVVVGGAHWQLLPVLCTVGAAVGGWGGAAVGGGLALAERVRPRSRLALVAGGAAGGAAAGALAHALAAWTMTELLGHTPTPLGGALEGLVLGGAVATGVALARLRETAGVAGAPATVASAGAPVLAGLCGAIAAGLLAAAGEPRPGSSLDAIAAGLRGSGVVAPLGALLGERSRVAGPATRLVVSLFEGGFFGAGFARGFGSRRG